MSNERISNEEFASIQAAKKNLAFAQVTAEKAHAERISAELQLKNLLLEAYLKNGLTINDTIDNAGNILRAKLEEESEISEQDLEEVKNEKS